MKYTLTISLRHTGRVAAFVTDHYNSTESQQRGGTVECPTQICHAGYNGAAEYSIISGDILRRLCSHVLIRPGQRAFLDCIGEGRNWTRSPLGCALPGLARVDCVKWKELSSHLIQRALGAASHETSVLQDVRYDGVDRASAHKYVGTGCWYRCTSLFI